MIFILVKCWVCQSLDCLLRAWVTFKWYVVYILPCRYFFLCWAVTLAVKDAACFKWRVVLTVGLHQTSDGKWWDSQSLHLYFTAISQVCLGVKIGRVSSTLQFLFLFLLHTSTSGTVLNTKVLITNSSEEKLSFYCLLLSAFTNNVEVALEVLFYSYSTFHFLAVN